MRAPSVSVHFLHLSELAPCSPKVQVYAVIRMQEPGPQKGDNKRSNGVWHAGIGPYVEMAFFHKRTRTLLTTDAVIFVPQQPPQVCLRLRQHQIALAW